MAARRRYQFIAMNADAVVESNLKLLGTLNSARQRLSVPGLSHNAEHFPQAAGRPILARLPTLRERRAPAIHQNFPGQYRHLFHRLAPVANIRSSAWESIANLARNTHGWQLPRSAMLLGYSSPTPAGANTHAYLRGYEAAIRRGQDWARAALQLKRQGFTPDEVCVHPGWGEALFAQVFPRAGVTFCEFYYQPHGARLRPQFPVELNDFCALRIKNSALNQALLERSHGSHPLAGAPTRAAAQLAVVHEGIDTRLLQPDPAARFILRDGRALDRSLPVVTFVNRNLNLIAAFTSSCARCQNCNDCGRMPRLSVGGDEVSYGRRPATAPPCSRSWTASWT